MPPSASISSPASSARLSAWVNAAQARAWAEFLVAPETQRVIGKFGKDRFGEPLFVPDAGKSVEDLGR